MGAPHYVAYDEESENGCELKSAACEKSEVMLLIKLLMGQTGEM